VATLEAQKARKSRHSLPFHPSSGGNFRHNLWIIPLLVFLLIILLLALVNGYSSYPQARYYKAMGDAYADKEGLIPFALQGALVTIARKPKPEQTQEEKVNQPEKQLAALGLTQDQKELIGGIQGLREAQVFATQMDAADSLYFLEPKDSFLSQSNISVTYYDGHHRIKAIGTEFQDNRIKVIEAVGGTLTLKCCLNEASEPLRAHKMRLTRHQVPARACRNSS
jgi:hypothetical protein